MEQPKYTPKFTPEQEEQRSRRERLLKEAMDTGLGLEEAIKRVVRAMAFIENGHIPDKN